MNSVLTSSSLPAFTPVPALVGGIMISSAVNGLLGLTGTVFGISGFIHKSADTFISFAPGPPDSIQSHNTNKRTKKGVAVAVTSGLVLGGTILGLFKQGIEGGLGVQLFDPIVNQDTPGNLGIVATLTAGFLIGLGTKLGSGCTSGHFLCGISRLSQRSIAATAAFFSIATFIHLATTSVEAAIPAVQSSVPVSRIILVLLALQFPLVVYEFVAPAIATKFEASDGGASHYYASLLGSFAAGVHFAFGLGLTGMLRPTKVLGFLNLSPARFANGSWDPSLGLVAVGGILPLSFYWFYNVKPRVEAATGGSDKCHSNWKVAGAGSEERNDTDPLIACAKGAGGELSNQPLFYQACEWTVPTSKQITAKLIIGGATFGVGWGLTGLCPGPVLVNFGTGRDTKHLGLFLAAIVAGGLFGGGIETSLESRGGISI
ncbi:hypothetical protein TWF694_004372 [Orbilia ellipsospora]|uniref:Sulphur transport domain-containing protein n=1 Tax=Orbilia ellipsospora TaxID=2528407 RepID=A0AAV9WYW9_9PEZI